MIAENNITAREIATNAVTSSLIAQNSILTKHIDDAQVNTAQLAGNSVSTAKIQDNAVTGDKIEDNPTIAGNLTVAGADVTITANIIHSGDNNTYFGFPTTDTFRVVTSGAEALRVNSSGNIGIQDSAPL